MENELEAAPPFEQGPRTATLRITVGLHRGASMELTSDQYMLGRDCGCDIQLRDAEVAARHCQFSRDGSGFTVRDVRAKVSKVLAPELVRYDAGIIEAYYRLGALQFSLRQSPPPPKDPSAAYQWLQRVPSWTVPAVLGVAVALAAATSARSGHEAAAKSRTVSAISGPASVAAAAEVRRRAETTLEEQARQVLGDDALHVHSHDGHLVLTGSTSHTLLKQRIGALADDLRGRVVVEDAIHYMEPSGTPASPGTLPVTVRSVMIGSPSYFQTDTGTRYFTGGVLPDGAEVLRIQAGEIQFRRAGQLITYKLR